MDFTNYKPALEYYPEDDIDMNDRMDVEDLAFQYGEISKLVDIGTVPICEQMEETVETITTEMATVFIRDTPKKNKYGPEQIPKFINLIQKEGISIPMAAKQCLIPRSSGYVLFNQFNSSNSTVLPGGSLKNSTEEHPKNFFLNKRFFLYATSIKIPLPLLA
jgi:hypothetical protein